MSKTVNIISLGCSKNTVDSEKLLKQFHHSGYKVSYDQSGKKSDLVIINTCGFINDAKEESIDTILDYIRAKEAGEIGQLYVMGCLSERYIDQLKNEIPEVDKYFGVNDIPNILRAEKTTFSKEIYYDRILSGPSHYAYLKISEGCDRSCAFCAIPGIRGSYVSVAMEELVTEAEILAAKGVRELILIAQDLSYYGIDLYKKQMLSSLIEKLSEVNGIEWIRLHYLYPANFPMDLIKLIRENPKVCNYIDIPIQHISDNVLGLMRRNHDTSTTKRIMETIKTGIPAAAIRTTVITGHPGETDSDFNELMTYVEEFRFDRLGVFTYSHEEDTYGQKHYKDNIPEQLKRDRADELMALQQEISLQKNMLMTGKELKVIIDREEEGYYIGRSEFDSPEVDQEIIIKSYKKSPKPGDFTLVKITNASEFDLEGELL